MPVYLLVKVEHVDFHAGRADGFAAPGSGAGCAADPLLCGARGGVLLVSE